MKRTMESESEQGVSSLIIVFFFFCGHPSVTSTPLEFASR